MRSWGLHREAGAEPGRHPPRGAKTRRSPQSMKPTISFGARRARARTAGREKSPITSPSLVSFTSSFTSSSCDRSSGSGEAAESTPRASSFGIVGRSGVSKGSRQARGSRRSHSRKKTSSPFRSIPKSSRRYETNPSPFFFFDASELEPSNSSKRAQQLPARTTPNASCLAKNAASPASASRAARGGANAPNRNEGRAFLAADVPSARLARLASFASFAAAAAAASRPYPRHFVGTLSLSDASTGTPYARG